MAPLLRCLPVLALATAALGEPSSFTVGSYGRASLGSDLRGRPGYSVNVVEHGPRLEERAYQELDLRWRPIGGASIVSTIAAAEDLFHYDGRFRATLAVRNLYLEVEDVLARGLALWVGSRLYRGDDVYLLDWWPMDNLNTLGAGARLRRWGAEVRMHVGVSRRDDPFQLAGETVLRPSGAVQEIAFLDRQRTVATAKATWHFGGRAPFAKAALYGELHALGAGDRREGLRSERLPADGGWVLGAQLGAWGFGESAFVNLFARVARGLAAYGDLSVPFGLAPDETTSGAQDVVVALSANWERGPFGLVAGGYARTFVDADPNRFDNDDLGEGTLALRPMWFVTDALHAAAELSVQARRPHGLDPETLRAETGVVWKGTLMAVVSPAGRGTYTRPHLRVYYTASAVDEAARRLLWAAEDPRRAQGVHHWLGASAEWWFDSSYGP